MREQISFINDGNKNYLVYEAGEDARRNNISLHMPEYNEIPQLLRMYPAEGRELKVNYDITDVVSLMDSLPEEAGRDDVFPVFQKLLFTLKALRMDFITEDDLLLQKEYIYIRNQTAMLNFAAVPDISEGRSVAALMQDIIDAVNWKKEEEKSYLTKLGEVLQRQDATNEDIHLVLKEILSSPVEYLPPEPEPEPIPEPVVQAAEPETSQLDMHIPEPQIPPVQIPEPQPQAPQPPEPPQFGHQVTAYGYSGGGSQNNAYQNNSYPGGGYAPDPYATVMATPDMGIAQDPYATIPAGMANLPDDEESFGETTVLGASSQPMIFPSLIRLKTNEKVVINKMEYLIGKDPSKVDYCIFDNSAVSRVHAKIICRNGEFFVIDNRSTNHVYVNGILIDANVEVRLSHGSHVRLGDEDFEFRFQ